MTDTDIDFDDVDLDEDGDDEALDFDHLTPEDGVYEVTIKDVSYRDGIRESDNKRVRGLAIRVQLVDEGDFDGLLLNKYIYLGSESFLPLGRKQMKSFCDAVGVPCEGNMRIADFQPVRQTIGSKQEKVLSVFSGLSCGAFVKTSTRTYNGAEQEQCEPTAFVTLERLAEIREFEPETPSFME